MNRKHVKIAQDTVVKLTEKFKKMGSITDQEVFVHVHKLMKVQPMWRWVHLQGVPKKSTRRLTADSSVSRPSIMHILKNHDEHPYKMQLLQHFCEDVERRMEFCKWVVNKLGGDANYPSGILFMDEARFKLIAKTYITAVIQPALDGSVKDARS
jgi:hypothetical protein